MNKFFSPLTEKNKIIGSAFLILIILLLVGQCFISYTSLYQQSINDKISAIRQALQTQHTTEEYHKESLAAFAATIATDNDVIKLLNEPTYDYIEISSIFKRIRKYIALSSPSSLVYIYSSSNRMIYDSYANTYKYGKNAPSLITECIEQFNSTSNSEYLVNNGNSESSYIARIFQPNTNPGDLIIIREDYYKTKNTYNALSNDLKSNIIKTDANGNILCGNADFTMGINIADEQLFKMRENDKYYQNVMLNGKKYIVYFLYSEYLNNWSIALTPQSSVIQGGLLSTKYICTYIVVLLSLFIFASFFAFWKRVSLTIFKLTALNKKKTSAANTSIDGSALHRLIISNSTTSIKKIHEFNSNLLPDYQYTAILLIKIDNANELKKNYSATDFELIKYGIENISTEVFIKHNFGCICINTSDDILEYVLCAKNQLCLNDFHSGSTECMSALSHYMPISTSYFLGDIVTVNDVHRSYITAHDTLKYLFICGKNAIIAHCEIKPSNQEKLIESKSLCTKIKNDIINISDCYYDDIAELSKLISQTNPQQAREILYTLTIELYSAVEYLEYNRNAVLIFDASQTLMTLDSIDYYQEFISIPNALFEEAKNALNNKPEQHSSLLVNECIAIIRQNYSDANLCLDEIAQKMNFSSNYLGRKFKELTGLSIAGVIKDIRLEAAANEIINTDKQIQDIMKQVGFINNSHFTALFKHKYGESPVNYRRLYKKNKQN